MQSLIRLPQNDCIRGGAFYFIVMEWLEANIKVTIQIKDSDGNPINVEVFDKSESYDEAIENARAICKETMDTEGHVIKVERGIYFASNNLQTWSD